MLLLAEMDSDRLAALPQADALRKYWRLLFHARVHAELELRAGRQAERGGHAQSGSPASAERRSRPRPPCCDKKTCCCLPRTSVRSTKSLRHVPRAPAFRTTSTAVVFPSSAVEEIDRILAEDVDAAAVVAETRLDGANDPVAKWKLPTRGDRKRNALTIQRRLLTPPRDSGEAAARSRRRGNLVRAALRCRRAAGSGMRQRSSAGVGQCRS